jgi:hypothetical protein
MFREIIGKLNSPVGAAHAWCALRTGELARGKYISGWTQKDSSWTRWSNASRRLAPIWGFDRCANGLNTLFLCTLYLLFHLNALTKLFYTNISYKLV